VIGGIAVVLDTNVAGAMLKDVPPTWLALYEPFLETTMHALSVQTEGELRRWALRQGWGRERWALLDRLLARVLVLPAERTVADAWARLMVHTEARGRALAPADAWVAATAVTNALPLVTHDKDLADLDFEGLDVICKA
jgi:toxin FitB